MPAALNWKYKEGEEVAIDRIERARASWEIKGFIAKGTPLSERLYGFRREGSWDANEGRGSKPRSVTFSVVRDIDQYSNQFINYHVSRSVIRT